MWSFQTQRVLIYRCTDFTYPVDISSKARDIRKVITQSSTSSWADFEESIAKVLNIFTNNLHAQYVLSTEPTNTIPISLGSDEDLAELHTRLAPLIVPPRNANGSKSKRKMKEVTVRVTDKSDDTISKTSSGNGKVRNIYILGNRIKYSRLFYRKRMKRESHQWALRQLALHSVTFTKRGSQSARPSGHTGGVKYTLSEKGLCLAGVMGTPPSVSQ